MVKPTVPREAACMIVEGGQTYCIDPLEEALAIISKRWALLVVGVLGNEHSVRFSDLKRTIPGISARALSSVLGDLQDADLASRHVDAEQSPPAVSYELTPRGKALRVALIPLIQWAGQ